MTLLIITAVLVQAVAFFVSFWIHRKSAAKKDKTINFIERKNKLENKFVDE